MYGPLSDENQALLEGYIKARNLDVLIRNFPGDDQNPYEVVNMFHEAEAGTTALNLLPIGPVLGTAAETTAKILRGEYTQGNSQRTPDGLNHLREQINLKWTHKTLYQWKVIRDFFKKEYPDEGLAPKLGVALIEYTLFGEEVPRKWSSSKLKGPVPEHGELYTFSVTLLEEFGR